MWSVVLLDQDGNLLSVWVFSTQANANTAGANFKSTESGGIKVYVVPVSAATDSAITTGFPGTTG